MRLNESVAVREYLFAHGMDNLVVADASELFLQRLAGIQSPEEKRNIIGDTFLAVKDAETAKLGLDSEHWLLAQGTIYPDTIESGGSEHADVIKTHHNRVAAVVEMLAKGLIVEPLADLYKDEVRALGEELGIPHELVWRHPFPGPGLGVRLLCADGTATGPVEIPGLDFFLSQNGLQGAVLPVRSVGVQGDMRSYAHPFALRGDHSWEAIEEYSTALTNRFAGLNRIVFQAAPEGALEYRLASQYCERSSLDLLREMDDLCTGFLREKGIYEDIWQMPVVLLPLRVQDKPVVVLRPVCSNEAMTATFYFMDRGLLRQLSARLLAAGAGAVLYDVTHKPPGTIEWE
jgi:GMP synthase (glutamine-hydrolysing)